MYQPHRHIDNKEAYIQQELISIFYRHLGKNVISVPGMIALVALFCWSLNPDLYLVIWFILLEAAILLGFIPLNRTFKRDAESQPVSHWQKRAATLAFMVSAMTGFLPWLVFDQLDSHVVVFVSISFCIAPGLIISYSSCYMPIWVGSTVGLIAPLMLYTFFNWDFAPDLGKIVAVWMVIGVVCYSYYLALSHHRQLRNYYNLQWDIRHSVRVAQSALETKHQFLAITSHDIRQPLDALAILIDLLKVQVLDKDVPNRDPKHNKKTAVIFKKINSNINAQKSIYELLLSISKLDTDDLDIHFENIRLEGLFASLKAEFNEQFQQKGLKLTFNDNDCSIFTDQYMCKSIIRNLVSNAYKYTDKGEVIIKAEPTETHIKISVKDTGIGIKDEDIQRVFEPFYQIGTQSKNYTNGLGLGLNIVSRTSEMINGKLDAESSLGKGSTFSVSLPMAS